MAADVVSERRVVLPSAADTTELGRDIGTRLGPGDLVVLAGPLGAGKTCLAAGIGEGLGVEGPITSPTFVIAREHPPLPEPLGGRGVVLVHVDAYRLGVGTGDPDPRDVAAQLDDLDLDTDLTRAAVVVEWGEGVAEHLASEHLLVRLDRSGADETREAHLQGPARLVAP
ncbi:tRNA (adenosine(37)-N6)-threonylcarbamoyltransferase complex ATPase subunit type 1 TsaE [Actinomycetospora straminea]|uniref:tRNA threonylcarbamoyladenosine biosynthesis protein TsaE n=1 Tax=Actinomycetospora straminea TaxID=663607 RepID=A0ABP9E6R2_9PSEU|nr:tRNA (adenosine(37)-N6)-threonylcarbamoyltransferase complex ATPase subunit type 1 TsaE [Actinomycetospora straminea]MDD7931247.1 tRNA (adenosine(37)-N6)-threonylcarbamoyltransferase complex ATPase subunit type 1 TsaE [Actinomycetospora straminea]